jgi:hypothetical protein
MITGQQTTTTTLTAQSVTPSTTAAVANDVLLYDATSDAGKYGFVATNTVTLSSSVYAAQNATIEAIDASSVTFTTTISAAAGDIMTKDYTGPHGTQDEKRRKRLLGLI